MIAAILLVLGISAASAGVVAGDGVIVTRVDGTTEIGDVIEAGDETVVVRTSTGERTIAWSDIARVNRFRSPRSRAPVIPDEACCLAPNYRGVPISLELSSGVLDARDDDGQVWPSVAAAAEVRVSRFVISARTIQAFELDICPDFGDGDCVESEYLNEFALVAGPIWRRGSVELGALGGLGYVEGNVDHEDERRFVATGASGELRARIVIVDAKLALGVALQGNLNERNPSIGARLTVSVGAF